MTGKPDFVKDWQDLKEISQGRLSLRIEDKNGNPKKEVRKTRVKGKGTREYTKEKGKPGWVEKKVPEDPTK